MVLSAEALDRARKRKADQLANQQLATSQGAVPDQGSGKLHKSDSSPAAAVPQQSSTASSSAQQTSQQQAAPKAIQGTAAAPSQALISAPAYILSNEQSKAVLTFNLQTIKALAVALSIDTAGKTASEMKCEVLRFCGSSDIANFDPGSSTFDFPNLVKQSFAQPAAQTPQ